MANSNVRFYKLATLPTFEEKHKGIFVHVTSNLTRTLNEGNYTYRWGKLNDKDIQDIVIQKIKERTILVPKWMDLRRIDTVESGLWFGGENGWELLSNDTTSGAIDAAINAKIQGLDVNGYAQAEINTDTPAEGEPNSSTLTIKGIKEVDGKIGIPAESESLDLKIAINGVYDKTDNKIATQSTVTKVIGTLNSEGTIQAVTFNTPENGGNTTLIFNGIKEENGVIVQGTSVGADTFIVGDAKLQIQIGSTTTDVFSANAQSNGTIKLNENVFQKGENNVISVITKNNDVSSTNPLVTQNDIDSLAGAMHYKGALTGAQSGDGSWPTTVAAGDVYIVTTGFTHGSDALESGDMVVFNSNNISDYKVIQSNLTLGIGDGQVAANVGALADGKLVVGVNSETEKGIKTLDFDVTNLTGTTGKNERNLTLKSQLADQELQSGGVQGLYHSVGITDTFTIMGRDMSKSFSISSRNRSISIEKVGGENSTDAQIDLIWNTVMDA